MRGHLLQDWISLRLATGVGVIQDEAGWLDLGVGQTCTFWITARSAASGGAGPPLLFLDTAPSKDSSLFQPFAGVSLADVLSQGGLVIVRPLVHPTVPPLARWLRWRLGQDGGPAGPWGATFRIHCAVTGPGAL